MWCLNAAWWWGGGVGAEAAAAPDVIRASTMCSCTLSQLCFELRNITVWHSQNNNLLVLSRYVRYVRHDSDYKDCNVMYVSWGETGVEICKSVQATNRCPRLVVSAPSSRKVSQQHQIDWMGKYGWVQCQVIQCYLRMVLFFPTVPACCLWPGVPTWPPKIFQTQQGPGAHRYFTYLTADIVALIH